MISEAHSTLRKRFDITIVGELNLDLILSGLPFDLPAERELLASAMKLTLGSSSAILAHNLAILGASIGFATRVGPDLFGKEALKRLAASGVRVEASTSPHTDTGLTVLLPHGDHRRILTYSGTIAELDCEQLDREFLASAKHFHLSSLFLQTGLHAGLPALLADLKSRGLTLSLDTNDDPAGQWGGILGEVLPLVDLLLPNEGELLRLARVDTLNEALESVGATVPAIVVKRGAQGATVYQQGKRTDIAPLRVTPVDTIGAGDSFNAGFLFAALHTDDLALCATAGNVTGALSTLRPGGTEAFLDPELRDSFLQQHWPVAIPRFAKAGGL